MRPINVSFPSCKMTLVIYSGTEYEKKAHIYGVRTDSPYVRINGKRDYLTVEEICLLKRLTPIFGGTK